MMFLLKLRRRLALIAIDFAIMVSVYAFVYLLEFGCSELLPGELAMRYLFNLLIFASFIYLGRFAFAVYFNVWRYANSKAYLSIVLADVIGGIVAIVVSLFIGKSVYLGSWWQSVAMVVMITTVTLVSRFVYQQLHKHSAKGRAGS